MSRDELVEKMARAIAADDGEPDEIVNVYTYSQEAGHGTIGKPFWQTHVHSVENALAAIHDAGFAVVPLRPTASLGMRGLIAHEAHTSTLSLREGNSEPIKTAYAAMVSAADLARAPSSAPAQEEG